MFKLKDDEKKCPFCAEIIKKEATVCRYCKIDLRTGKPFSGNIQKTSQTQSQQKEKGTAPLTLPKAFGLYLLVLVIYIICLPVPVFIMVLILPNISDIGESTETALYVIYMVYLFVTYFLCGLFLNRKVLAKMVDWHPIWKTIDIVSYEKWRQLMLWPFSYPFLFLRILFYKKL